MASDSPVTSIDPLTLLVSRRAADTRLLEVAHVAHRLSASQDFIRRLIRDDKLPAIRLGTRWRIDPRELEAYIERCKKASVPTVISIAKPHAVPRS